MLSKFIYRFLAVALLALCTQVGMSQNYVDSDAADAILEEAISDLQADLDDGLPYTGSLQSITALDNDKISLQLMKTVKVEIDTEKAVAPVMDFWAAKANAQTGDRQTKLILALDKVKALLLI